MKKLFLALILSLFSIHVYAGSCPDGSDPVKSISDDGTYFVYNCSGGNEQASSSTAKSLKFELDTENGKLEDYSYITDPTGNFNKVHKFTTGSECGSKTRDIDWDNMVGEMETSDCGENSVRSQMVEQVWEDNRPGDIQPKYQWYTWDVYLPEDFPMQDSGKLLLGEFHNGECAHISFTSRGGDDKDKGVLHFETMKLWNGDCKATSRIPITQIQDMRGKWTNFHLEMKWENNETGLANLWLNGKQVLAYKGRTLTLQKENLNFMLFGLYQCCNDRDKVIKPAMAYFTTPKTSMNPITPVEVTLDNKKTASSFKAKSNEFEASLASVGEFDLKKLGENTNPNLYAFSVHGETFDINQDGHDDLIIPIASMNSKHRNVPNEFSKPALLFWDDSLKKYKVDKEVQKALPLLYWPRRIRSSINPKTGFTEIFVADMGLDLANYDFSKGIENLPPNCGGQNHLITFDPASGNVAEIPLPKLWDVSHGLAAADLNGDQVTDYVVLNSPYIKFPAKCKYKDVDYTNESYILYSNKMGGFDKTSIKLNYEGYSKAPSIQSGEVIFDENNQAYLVIGSEAGKGDAYLYLMKQDSNTSFTETSKVKAPTILKTVGAPVYGEILVADVDADGKEEIIASSNTVDDSNSLWVGRYLQIFDIKNGKLLERPGDITQSSTSEITKGNDWCHHLFFNEQSAWNEPILTCTTPQAQIKTKKTSFYTRNNNMLQQAKMKFKSYNDIDNFNWMRSFYPVTLNEQAIFVGKQISGKKIMNGEEVYNSIKLYILKPSDKNIDVVKPLEQVKKVGEAAKNFDGSYALIIRTEPTDGQKNIGTAQFIIKDGKISIARKYRYLSTSAISSYDTFEGVVDKEGNIKASIELNPIMHMVEPKTIKFSGSMDSLQLRGKFDDIKSWDNNTKGYVLDENFYPYDVIIEFKKENY